MTKRLVIHLGNDDNDVIWKKGGIVSMYHKFLPADFLDAPEQEREQVILDVIHQCVTRCCATAFDWSFAAFERAYLKIGSEKGDLVRQGRLIRSPDRKHYASVVMALNQRNAIVSARFFDHHKAVICDVELIKTFQGSFLNSEILRRMEWIDASTFAIGDKNGELRIEASITREMMVMFEPQRKTLEELQGLLRMCTYREFTSESERIAWINQ